MRLSLFLVDLPLTLLSAKPCIYFQSSTCPLSADECDYDSDRALFIDAADPTKFICRAELLLLVERLGFGLRHVGAVQPGDVVFLASPNTASTLPYQSI